MKRGLLYAEQLGQTKLQGSSVFARYFITTVFSDIVYDVHTITNKLGQKLLYPFIREIFYPLLWTLFQFTKKDYLASFDIVNFVSSTTLAFTKKSTSYKKVLFLSCLYALQIQYFRNSLKNDLSVSILYFVFLPILSSLERLAINKADLVIVPQRKMIKFLIDNWNIDTNKLVYLPNFIESNAKEINAAEKKFDVVYIGRLSKGKGVHYLVDIVRNCPEVSFAIIGQGQYLKKFSNLQNVKFLGKASHELRDEILSQSKLGIMPSLSETGPLVTLEELRAGLPVIASTEGAGEYVIEGENGYIFKPEEIAEKSPKLIKKLLNDSNKYKLMSQKAKESSKPYLSNSKLIKDQTKIIYKKLWENI